MKWIRSLIAAATALAIVAGTASCTTTQAERNISQTERQASQASESVQKEAVRKGSPVTPTGQFVARDGIDFYSSVSGLERLPDGNVYENEKTGLPVPYQAVVRGTWNLTNDFSGLTDGTLQFATIDPDRPAWASPAWNGLNINVGRADSAATNPDVIRAAGEAQALEKAAVGDAAAEHLRQKYIGKVAMLKAGGEWIVTLGDVANGVLDRVIPLNAATRAADQALKVVFKDGTEAKVDGDGTVTDIKEPDPEE